MWTHVWFNLQQIHRLLNAIDVYIGLVGFGATLWGLRLTFQAARQARQNAINAAEMARSAKEAADSAVLRLAKYNLISDVSAASGLAEEIRRYQDQEDWDSLPDKYNKLAKMYVRMKSRRGLLNTDELTNMQSGVTSVRELANSLKESRAVNEFPNAARFNKVITSHIDDLLELSIRLGETHES